MARASGLSMPFGFHLALWIMLASRQTPAKDTGTSPPVLMASPSSGDLTASCPFSPASAGSLLVGDFSVACTSQLQSFGSGFDQGACCIQPAHQVLNSRALLAARC